MSNYINQEKNFISIVVYVKNQATQLGRFLEEINSIIKPKFANYEYVIVNDNSSEDLSETLDKASKYIEKTMNIVNLAYDHGLEMSMIAGVDISIGDFVYEFDSVEIDYEPQLILDVYKHMLTGFDVVSASRSNTNVSSKSFYYYLSKVSYKKMKLRSETFRIISRRAINRVSVDKGKTKYRKALYHYSGLSTDYVNYDEIRKCRHNESSFKEKRDLALDVLINYSDIGIRLAGLVSSMFMFFTCATIIYTIVTFLTLDNIQAGWATTMLFLSVSFTGVFFILFILSKYLVNILNEIREGHTYVYKSVQKK